MEDNVYVQITKGKRGKSYRVRKGIGKFSVHPTSSALIKKYKWTKTYRRNGRRITKKEYDKLRKAK